MDVIYLSVSRLVAGRIEQRGCVYIWRSSLVLRRDSEISLRKQCNPQAPAGQELCRRGSETHPEASHGGRDPLHYGRAHPCTGVTGL